MADQCDADVCLKLPATRYRSWESRCGLTSPHIKTTLPAPVDQINSGCAAKQASWRKKPGEVLEQSRHGSRKFEWNINADVDSKIRAFDTKKCPEIFRYKR